LRQNSQLQDPHPKEIYNHIQKLYLDARNVWQTTYISHGIVLLRDSPYAYKLKTWPPPIVIYKQQPRKSQNYHFV
jgi:hypothetical protein